MHASKNDGWRMQESFLIPRCKRCYSFYRGENFQLIPCTFKQNWNLCEISPNFQPSLKSVLKAERVVQMSIIWTHFEGLLYRFKSSKVCWNRLDVFSVTERFLKKSAGVRTVQPNLAPEENNVVWRLFWQSGISYGQDTAFFQLAP